MSYKKPEVRTCRKCKCTDDDCSQCIEKKGYPCHWVEEDLCSACIDDPEPEGDIMDEPKRIFNHKNKHNAKEKRATRKASGGSQRR